jgi:acyl dehydratase
MTTDRTDLDAAKRRYADDLENGHRYVSSAHRMTQQEIIEFARQYDPQYLHLDAEAARASSFGGLIASGLQSVALCWKLAQATGVFDGMVLAGIGLDEIRWHKPVYVGDEVRVEFSLLESRRSQSRPDCAITKFLYEMKNQRDERVLSLKMLQLMRARPQSETSSTIPQRNP